ncbi:MAG: glycosyltransferase [Chloroflexi bacterium]|nr:glycosyltransferase [Chloroflexota bacterium]MBV9134665.1 glycosyltransferase [Chloroflexota bacterium]MBV9892949.1 glycosyltransferase [Chloroflexota bacterium]
MKARPRVLYVQYTSPSAYPPLEHGSQLLAEAGWDVLFLGTSKVGDPALHWSARQGIHVRELPPAGSGWLRRLHYGWFAAWVLAWTLRWRPRCVYASDLLACPIVLALSYVPGLLVVYHEHDTPLHGGRAFRWARRKLATRADVRVLPNQLRATHFNETVANHRPTLTAWNCPARSELAPRREARSTDELKLVYAGSIVPERLPATVIEALAHVPGAVQLDVVGYTTQGHPEYVRELQSFAMRLGVEQRVRFMPAVPHPELLEQLRTADVGLVLMSEWGDAQWMPGASNKPFDYLASGLALLVADEPGWRELYADPGYGLACNAREPQSIAAALTWFLENRDEMRAMGERGRQRVAQDWNYETQFGPVRDWLVRRAVG